MENYTLFLTVATATILSPGPGVAFTLTNALRYGLAETSGGIFGIALGAMIIAGISATGVGLILTTSPIAFEILKYAGAFYLLYLGVRMWLAPSTAPEEKGIGKRSWRGRFLEGITLQFSNPKAIFFFISVFPQFINNSLPYAAQFSSLVLTYGILVVIIHMLYALTAHQTRGWLASPRGRLAVNRIGGTAFIFFAVVLATSKM